MARTTETPSSVFIAREVLAGYPWLAKNSVREFADMHTFSKALQFTVHPPYSPNLAYVDVLPIRYYVRLDNLVHTSAVDHAKHAARQAVHMLSDEIARRAAGRRVPLNPIRDVVRFACPRIGQLEQVLLAESHPGFMIHDPEFASGKYDVFGGTLKIDGHEEDLTAGALGEHGEICRWFCIVSLRDGVLWGKDDCSQDDCWRMIYGI